MLQIGWAWLGRVIPSCSEGTQACCRATTKHTWLKNMLFATFGPCVSAWHCVSIWFSIPTHDWRPVALRNFDATPDFPGTQQHISKFAEGSPGGYQGLD